MQAANAKVDRVRATGRKGERTRHAVLEAAERVFAARGYAAARLEEVAALSALRRASLVYYFRTKRELYDAVLSDIFGELLERYRAALAAPVPLRERIESVIDAWVGYVAERPSVARLLLWEAADGSREGLVNAATHADAVLAELTRTIEQGQREGLFRPIDPVHFILTIIGATVFFVAATPRIVPGWPFDPLSNDQIEAHHRELLGISRRLLGTGAPSPAGGRRRTAPAGSRGSLAGAFANDGEDPCC